MENKLGDPSCLLCERVAGLAWRKKRGKPRTGAEEILVGEKEGRKGEKRGEIGNGG